MFLVIYDISDDLLRAKLSRFLSRFGRRLQFSVFEIRNSNRILDNIRVEIKNTFEKKFSQGDSVMVLRVDDNAICDRFGYAKNEEQDLLFSTGLANLRPNFFSLPQEKIKIRLHIRKKRIY